MKSSVEHRIQVLTARLIDNELTESEAEELSNLLGNNQQAIQEYVDLTAIDFQLHGKKWMPLQESLLSEKSRIESLSPKDSGFHLSRKRFPFKKNRQTLYLAVAASLILALGIFATRSQHKAVVIARVTDLVDCNWDSARWGLPRFNEICQGDVLEFDHGLMILSFASGAEVVLEGPVRFKVINSNRGYLSSGALTADVPRRANGFAIDMPLAEAIDLGTRFGAKVDREGRCETHVLQGNVVVITNKDSLPKEWHLGAGEALAVAEDGVDPLRLAAQPHLFQNPKNLSQASIPNKHSEFDVPIHSGLTLWLEASQLVERDPQGRVSCWGDIGIGDNTVSDNAWQVDMRHRPRWIQKAAADKPAIRFDGTSFLVTRPFSSSEDLSVICVFQGQPEEFPQQKTGPLICFSGTSRLILEQSRDNRIMASVGSAGLVEAPVESGRLKSSAAVDLPTVCVFTYRSTANRAVLYINGEEISSTEASVSPAGISSKVIGYEVGASDYFIGEIYEIMVFDTALLSEHCIRISSDLMSKYGISEKEREPRVLSGLIPEEE